MSTYFHAFISLGHLILSTSLIVVYGQTEGCKWESRGHILDLSPFSADTVAMTNEYLYYYTPCRNALLCNNIDGSQTEVMVDQLNEDSIEDCEAYLALWDDSITPTFHQRDDVDVWTFTYNNGQTDDYSGGCTDGRSITINWICDRSDELKADTIKENPECVYTLNINSSYACL